ncbi:MAG TPA: hypothetical protein VFE98_02710 [Candidatus Bathyarchaeia archaeon]|nr:hypothetical protein [Candidatus Bathyarchaeia archaeon]
MEREENQERTEDSQTLVDNLCKKKKRLPSQETLRREPLYPLRESQRISEETMKNRELSLAEQDTGPAHMRTPHVPNTILRDQQFREWERRLKELEERGLVTSGVLTISEP